MTALPYGGARDPNSGFQGSDTSEARARTDDASGVTSKRQQQVIRMLAQCGLRGATWKEVATHFNWHHGQASAALSNLHKVGQIARLTETRARCKVYVLPMNVARRETEPPGVRSRLVDDMAALLRTIPPCSHSVAVEGCNRCTVRDLLKRYEG